MEYIFIIFFIVIAGIILFSVFSTRARRWSVQLTFGEVVQDYGNIDSMRINRLIQQTMHMYKCRSKSNEESFFVLEVTKSVMLSFHINYIKISSEAAEKMIKILSEK